MKREAEKLSAGEAIQGYAVRLSPSEDAQPFSAYHDPRTGKVFARLPADAWSLNHYRRRGLKLGLPTGQPRVSDKIDTDTPDEDLKELLQAMRREINELRAKLSASTGTPEPESVQEPVQLRFM